MAFRRFEAFAQRLVEDNFHRSWGKGLQPLEVARQLADRMAADWLSGTAVSGYTIQVNPGDYESLLGFHPHFVQDIEQFGQKLAQQANIPAPKVKIQLESKTLPASIQISSMIVNNDNDAPTQVQKALNNKNEAVLESLLARQAFLVVNGRDHHPLNKPLFTIGRQLDNDIVLPSNSVSRQHAQIRWRHGRFVLFNVSGRGKTAVNGIRKQEHILHSGDLIQLSQESLIFAEEGDNAGLDPDEPTQPYTPIRNR